MPNPHVRGLLEVHPTADRLPTDVEPPLDDEVQEVVQFLVPRHALAAISVVAIVAEARRAGARGLRITMNDRGANASETRLTCGVPMALRLVHALERAAAVAADNRDDLLSLDLAAAHRGVTNAIGAAMNRKSILVPSVVDGREATLR